MPGMNEDAAKPKTRENDMVKPDAPPRPATEPVKTSSTKNKHTETDPATGEPQH